jgi:RsiW-degrading membrane proteinase PrsW (M82 family)
MKFPKLRHAGLCNILIFLPALFLFFAIGFNIPLANWGTPKWVLALNFLLGCAVSLGYLILGAFPLLCADQVFFLLRVRTWCCSARAAARRLVPPRRR